jgi:hypothetical protein
MSPIRCPEPPVDLLPRTPLPVAGDPAVRRRDLHRQGDTTWSAGYVDHERPVTGFPFDITPP